MTAIVDWMRGAARPAAVKARSSVAPSEAGWEHVAVDLGGLPATRYRSGRAMRSHHSLRASDADRDAVVDRLREAAGEGRLEADELEQRVDGALRARTYGDLAELLADLPADGRMSSQRRGWRTNPAARSAVFGAGLLVAVIVAFVVVAVVAMLVVAAAATWIALVLVRGPAGRRSVSARHARRVRPTGLL
jgi:Flp pilus assembly protein TadB